MTVTNTATIDTDTILPAGFWSHMLLDGGTTEPRIFKSAPEVCGHHEFHPKVPMFYLVLVSRDGWEYMGWIGVDRNAGLAFADDARQKYGITNLVDLTIAGRA